MSTIVENPNGAKYLLIMWHAHDIRNLAVSLLDMNLTIGQANEVLEALDYNHDPEVGINWEVIKQAIRKVVKLTPEHEAFYKAFTNEMNQYPLTKEQFKSYMLTDRSVVPDETITALADAWGLWQLAVRFGKEYSNTEVNTPSTPE